MKTSPKLDGMADGAMLGKGKVEIKCRPDALWAITADDHEAPATLVGEESEKLPPPVSPVGEKNTLEKTQV